MLKPDHHHRDRWFSNQNPPHLSFPAHGSLIVTCLIISDGRIISASEGSTICVFSPTTGRLLRSLEGHEGGVWALASSQDTLVSGSTDKTVRVWDLSSGRCTHVFRGHTATVRCLSVVEPEWIEVGGEAGLTAQERWPNQPLIVSGSRDRSLRVWTLPQPGDKEYGFDEENNATDVKNNPYFNHHLEGHQQSVHSLAARGRTLVSGSYDYDVRIWDIVTGECKWVLTGHSHKVYNVGLNLARNQAYSSSMDGTVRVWDLRTGQCQHVLTGHTSIVGLLDVSPSYLVSASPDCTIRVWDPNTGDLRHILASHTEVISCLQHDAFKLLSGSNGSLKLWDIQDGTVVRELLTGKENVWKLAFNDKWCVAASHDKGATVMDVWDFGVDGGPTQL